MTRRLLDLVTRNFPLKVAAFGLALLLWVSVRAERQDRRELPSVPVRVTLDDPEWTLRGDPLPATVEVRLSGPARTLFQVALDRPVLVIPLNRVTSPDSVVVLSRDWLRMGSRPGVVVEDIQPSSVRLAFERVLAMTAPVAPRLRGELPGGLVLSGPPTTEPAAVRISGPAGRVEAVDSARLVPVELGEVEWDRPLRVAVDTTGFGRLRVSPDTVTLRLQAEMPVERVLPEVEVEIPFRDLLPGVEVDTPRVSVLLRGPRGAVDGAAAGAVRAELDPAHLLALQPGDSARLPVRVLGVPPLVVARSTPDSLTVRRPGGSPSPDPAEGEPPP